MATIVVEKNTVTNRGVAAVVVLQVRSCKHHRVENIPEPIVPRTLLHGCAKVSREPWFHKISISMQSTSATWVQAAAQMCLQLDIAAKFKTH